MARKPRPEALSPLISGSLFKSATRRSRKIAEKPLLAETMNDAKELLYNLMVQFADTVDRHYPNADFLSQANMPKSKIPKGTHLSFVMRICFGLSQMKLPADIVENYQKTLSLFLKELQQDPTQRTEYQSLHHIFKVFKQVAETFAQQGTMRDELRRLEALDLSSKTIDRRLQRDFVQTALLEPIEKLTADVERATTECEHLQSFKLTGSNNSLQGLVRQLHKGDNQTTHSPQIDEISIPTPVFSVGAAAAAA